MKLQGSQVHRAMYGNKSGFIAPTRTQSRQRGSELSVEGIIDAVFFTTRMPSVNVKVINGGFYRFLPFPGGTIDPLTGNFHGDFIQPIVGQKVIVSYTNGDISSPYISELIFRTGVGKDAKLYTNFPITSGMAEGDMMRSHKSGGLQIFSKEKIVTRFTVKIDILGNGKIEQDPSGMNLGKGGIGQVYSPVALVGENFVLTSLGLQPIQSALTRIGPLAVTVKV